MGGVIYILSALTSLACAVLSLRGYFRTRVKMLLGTGVFFSLLTINNIVLFIDLELFPKELDLSLVRNIPTLLGLIFLIGTLIYDSE